MKDNPFSISHRGAKTVRHYLLGRFGKYYLFRYHLEYQTNAGLHPSCWQGPLPKAYGQYPDRTEICKDSFTGVISWWMSEHKSEHKRVHDSNVMLEQYETA